MAHKNPEDKRAYDAAHYAANRVHRKAVMARYRETHPPVKQTAYHRVYAANRCRNDPEYKLRRMLRSRLNAALSGRFKSGSAIDDLGCSVAELRVWLEGMFQPGMTWDNHGEWHIDHIVPLATFNLTDRTQLLIACNYRNLQPLWAKANLSKGRKNPHLTSPQS